ncbi:MAG: PA2778 family cysteine peptidase, partial [Wenzhouxiangellaceae bacterium]|nr:PA2778 family cysteine peptidase [Wenzhouxiangellaceae bacterium]
MLEDTPFFPQLAHHCGPAALATVLGAAGVEPGYDAVVERVYVPGLQGTLQVEMMAAARGYDRIPFRVPGTLEDVLAQVEAGTPVLVLQNLRIRTWPAWHYAVVIGYDRERRRILMRSGTVPELATPVGRWMRQWDWASRWGIVVLRPGELPARPKRANVYRALADFDERGRPEFRLAAWSAAAGRWPGDVLPRVGMANALLALKRSEEAEERYREALVIDAGHWPARLNLANLLLE